MKKESRNYSATIARTLRSSTALPLCVVAWFWCSSQGIQATTLVTWAGETNVPANLTNVVAVAAGAQYDLALNADGTVVGWGNNQDYYGGNAGEATIPAGLSNVVAIATGGYDSLALKADGTVAVWGWNNCGQTNVPAGSSNVVAVAAGWQHSLALKSDGTVVTWGLSADNLSPVPASVSNVVAIAAGQFHSLALRADGTVVAWGDDYDFLGNYAGQCEVPADLSNVVAVAGLWSASLALKTDGTVVAWGENYDGATSVPAGLTNVVSLACGREATLALNPDSTVTGWGDNSFGTVVVPSGVTNFMALAVGFANDMALTGTEAPRQVQPPFNFTMSAQGTALFKTHFLGAPPITYQWQQNGTNIPGANLDTLLLTNLQFAQASVYSVIASNHYGVTQSSNATLTVLPLLITAPPTNQLLYVGDSTTLAVAVSGVPPFGYQWYSNNVPLAGQTNISLALGPATTNMSANYNVVITNPYGSLPSSNAVVTVVPLTAAVQPASQSVYGGDNATFTVSAQKAGPFTFQWLFNETMLPNQTNTTLTVPTATTNQTGSYSVLAANTNGMAESTPGILTVVPITAAIQPASQSLYVGDTATFTASVQENGPFAYQWSFRGAALSGQTNAVLTVSNLTTNQAGSYTVFAANPYGAITSAPATLLVTDSPPVLQSATGNQLLLPGATANFTVNVAGSKPLLYQWSFNGQPLAGATNATLTLNSVRTNQAGAYTVAVSNALGGFTWSVTLTLEPVLAWGINSSGQSSYEFSQLSNAVAIAAGEYHSVAARADGSVFAWGSQYGSAIPSNVTNVVALAAGDAFTLAARADGTVVEWGTASLPPVPVGLSNVVSVTVGYWPDSSPQTCFALKADGTVAAWCNGGSSYGSATNIPVGLQGAVAVAGGYAQALVARADGSVMGWQVYPATTANIPPAALTNGNNVVAVAVGTHHALALKADGTVAVWGDNSYGQTNLPAGLSNVVAIAAGAYHSVALRSDGSAVAWGYNNNGQTNVPSAFSNLVAVSGGSYNNVGLVAVTDPTIVRQPSTVPAVPGKPALLSVGAVSRSRLSYQWRFNGQPLSGATNSSYRVPFLHGQNGAYSVIVSSASGSVTSSVAQVALSGAAVLAWGRGDQGQTNVPAGLSAVAVGGGSAHSLALQPNGTVAAWGSYLYGVTNVPASATNVIAISSGYSDNVALRADGSVVEWGTAPVMPASQSNTVAIAAGNGYTLALNSNGMVNVWGNLSPILAGTSNFVAMSAGSAQALALKSDGSLFTWGSGWGLPGSSSNVVAISSGNGFNLAVKTDGTVLAWGNNGSGQCNVPTGLSNVVAIAAGDSHGLALKSDGSVVAWGQNTYGQTNVPPGQNGGVAIAAGSYHSLLIASASDPAIARQPAPVYASVFGRVLLSVGAVSSQPMSYQWLANGVPLGGATNSWLDLPAIQTTDSGLYSVIVSNALGLVVSSNAIVGVVDRAPFVVAAPGDQTIPAGDTAAFQVLANGTQPITYQWLFNGINIANATNAWLTLTNVPAAGAGTYTVALANPYGTNTASAVLTVQPLAFNNTSGNMGLTADGFNLQMDGVYAPNSLVIYASTDLLNWVPIFTNGSATGTVFYLDPTVTNSPLRFYRVEEQ